MPIRVISGVAKGRKLKLVPGQSTRPIMDRVKEALFNILGQGIRDSTFLDLFAGTGSVGIEALSRGAAYVLFVDTDRLAIKTIKENLRHTGLEERAEVRRMDALGYLRGSATVKFEYVFVAPPQYHGIWKAALVALDENPHHLAPDGVVIVQIDPHEREEVELKHLHAYDERMYGKTMLWFFEHGSEQEEGRLEK